MIKTVSYYTYHYITVVQLDDTALHKLISVHGNTLRSFLSTREIQGVRKARQVRNLVQENTKRERIIYISVYTTLDTALANTVCFSFSTSDCILSHFILFYYTPVLYFNTKHLIIPKRSALATLFVNQRPNCRWTAETCSSIK
jgi:hypothetical protein